MCGVEGNRMQDLHIEVRDQDIVVTMPGTSRASSHPLAHTLLAQARAKRAPRCLWHLADIDARR